MCASTHGAEREDRSVFTNLKPLHSNSHHAVNEINTNPRVLQHFFKTASKFMHSPLLSMWGVKNNKVFQLNKDGELRYSNRLMMEEGKPNRGAAGRLCLVALSASPVDLVKTTGGAVHIVSQEAEYF